MKPYRPSSGIGVWRAPDLDRPPLTKKTTAKTGPATVGQKTKTRKPVVVEINNGGITTNSDGSARIPLRPNDGQRLVFDTLFGGPLLLQGLVASNMEPITTKEQASLFLLKHFKALDPFLHAQNRAFVIDWLKSLVLDWSTKPSDMIEVALPSDCSISSQQEIYFPLPRLGPVSPKDPAAVQKLRTGRRYVNSFSLVCQNGKYFADVAFEAPTFTPREPTPHQASAKTLPKRPQYADTKNRTQNKKAGIPLEAILAMFDSALNARLMAELRTSQQYSRTQFEKLEGWGVNGGLPSLGKRR